MVVTQSVVVWRESQRASQGMPAYIIRPRKEGARIVLNQDVGAASLQAAAVVVKVTAVVVEVVAAVTG
jgi:hypothetical protein